MSSSEKKFCELPLLGLKMAYIDSSDGSSNDNLIVLVHGNPTSSYVWRNIVPNLAPLGRCIAVDLIGMGDSDKMASTASSPAVEDFTFHKHSEYLDSFLENCMGDFTKVTLVLHEWGSALGFSWASRNSEKVKGIVHMESIVRPFLTPTLPTEVGIFYRQVRGDDGDLKVLQENVWIEQALPGGIQRTLSAADFDAYRAPFETPSSRIPLLVWGNEFPIDGQPADVASDVAAYSQWLSASADIPKLMLVGNPGRLLAGSDLAFARGLPNQKEVTVDGIHFLQEDSPNEISEAIVEWMNEIPPPVSPPVAAPTAPMDAPGSNESAGGSFGPTIMVPMLIMLWIKLMGR